MAYNVTNWYWNVGNSTSQVWSSARVQYVPLTDATYVAWVAQGNVATNITSEAELEAVFAAQYPAGWPAQPITLLTPLEFLALFTPAETTAIQTAALSSQAILNWCLQAAAASQIDLTSPLTKAGLDALVAANLLTSARETVILTPSTTVPTPN